MRIRSVIALAAAAAVLAACGGATAGAGAPAKPQAKAVAARHFSAHVDNPWFPLKPGTIYRFRGEEDGTPTRDVVRVTHRTKLIQGVHARVVRDRVYKHGRVVEDTRDWFAQDSKGTVWYFGEDTRELDRHGHTTTTEGSWQSGRHGARRGVIMPAHPRVGYSAAQEHFKGHAEDHFKVIRKHASVTVPYGRFRHRAVVTREWTPLEPGVVDHKLYVRGIGMVKENTVKGGDEVGRLVSISHR
jgi:predicted small secreted protein